jgi:hypothetical protein
LPGKGRTAANCLAKAICCALFIARRRKNLYHARRTAEGKKGAGHETLGSIAMHVSKNTWQTKAKSKTKNSAAQGTPLLVLLHA